MFDEDKTGHCQNHELFAESLRTSREEQRPFGVHRLNRGRPLKPTGISPHPALAVPPLCSSRQELLATLLHADTDTGTVGPKGSSSAKMSGASAPTAAQVRGVVGPLEQALQIYTDMKNAPQAAACHYQVQYNKLVNTNTKTTTGFARVELSVQAIGRDVAVELKDR